MRFNTKKKTRVEPEWTWHLNKCVLPVEGSALLDCVFENLDMSKYIFYVFSGPVFSGPGRALMAKAFEIGAPRGSTRDQKPRQKNIIREPSISDTLYEEFC